MTGKLYTSRLQLKRSEENMFPLIKILTFLESPMDQITKLKCLLF